MATTDIVSYDVYPVAGIRKSDGERYLWYVAKGVDSLRHWATDGQPVWNVIGTTRINAERGPTPAQVLRGVDVDRTDRRAYSTSTTNGTRYSVRRACWRTTPCALRWPR